MIDLVWLMPLKQPDYYERGGELPSVWKPSYAETQPFACVDHWSHQLFAVHDGLFTLLRGREIALEAEKQEAANAAAEKVWCQLSCCPAVWSVFGCLVVVSDCSLVDSVALLLFSALSPVDCGIPVSISIVQQQLLL